MKITDNIYLVGSGKLWGFGISHKLDCNVYLIDTGEGCILIDSGTGIEPERIDANIKAAGFEISDIKIIFLSHYHGDHACGAARIYKASGCKVYAPAQEAQAIIEGDEEITSVGMAKGIIYPEDFQYPKCPGVIGLNDGDEVKLGNVTIKVFMVPGHSLCSMVMYGEIDNKKCIFTGDSVFSKGQVLIQSLKDVSLYPYGKAMEKLAKLEIDAFFPGHGVFTLEDGDSHIKSCADKFAVGLIPPQLYYFT